MPLFKVSSVVLSILRLYASYRYSLIGIVAGSLVAVTQSMTETTTSRIIPIGMNILIKSNFKTRSVIVTQIMIDEMMLIKTKEEIGAHKFIPN